MSGRAIGVRDALTYAPILHHAITADGNRVAVVSPRFDAATQSRRPRLFVRALDGDGTWAEIGPEDARYHTPAWSPDGKLAALRTWNDTSDVAVIDPDDPGAPGQGLPGLPAYAVALTWWGATPRLACLGEDAEGVRRVWSWDDPTVGPRAVTPPKKRVGDFAFGFRSNAFAWLHAPARPVGGADPGTVLYVTLDAHKKAVAVALPEPWIGFLAWSPDGAHLAGLARPTDEPLTQPRLWVLDVRRQEAWRLLEDQDGWITGFDWRPDGQGLVVAIEQGVAGRLFEVDLDGDARPVGLADTYLSGPRFDRASGRMLFLRQDGDVPQHVRVLHPGQTRSDAVTRWHERLRTATLYPQERVTWTAPDGLEIEGLLMLPAVANPPVVVWIHGGPAENLQRTFSMHFQLLLANGWAVLAPNFRGSTGRDDAFLQAIAGRVGVSDVSDVLAGVDALSDRIDPARVAFMGWSYGGSVALGCAAARPTTRAVIAGAPVVDWLGAFGAWSWPWLTPRYFGPSPWVDAGPYDRASVIRRIATVRAPTLFLHGEADDRVPVAQSRAAYRMLQANGVPTDLRLFPGEPHVFSAPWAVQEMLVRVVGWLKTHL